MDPETNQQAQTEVRALKPFGIGETLIEPGAIILVSRTRAAYLKFLGLVELV